MSQLHGKQVLPQFSQDIHGPAIYAAEKHFLIDHPDRPDDMVLVHGCLEGPEHGVYARGVARGTHVGFPCYWGNLVDEKTITVHITPMTALSARAMPYVYAVNSGGFSVATINCDHDEMLKYNWYALATRKDVGPLDVERAKSKKEPERGRLDSFLNFAARLYARAVTTI